VVGAPAIDDPTGLTTRQRQLLWAGRIALVALLLFTVLFDHLPQFVGKGMPFRAPFYGASALFIPIVWRLRGRPSPYPWRIDLLVMAPFFCDTAANALNFYNDYDRTDDVLHFTNWMLLGAAIVLACQRAEMGRLNAWAMAWGMGALAIIWWEAAEFVVQELGTAGLGLTYEDTVGDLLLSSTGGAVGAAITLWILARRAQSSS